MNDKCQSSNDKFGDGPQKGKTYDLQERTARFGEEVISFARLLVRDCVSQPLISQVVRSATSVGANYMEADGAITKKDFQHKIGLCRKESKETEHWLRMIAKANAERAAHCRRLSTEAHELTLIFSSILIRSRKRDEDRCG